MVVVRGQGAMVKGWYRRGLGPLTAKKTERVAPGIRLYSTTITVARL